MPGPPRSEKSSVRQSTDTKDTMKTQKVNQMDPKKVSRRQELAEKSHILRLQKTGALSSKAIGTLKLRRKSNPASATTKKPIAAAILLKSNLTTNKWPAAARTRDYVKGSVTDTTNTSIEDGDQSTPPPDDGSNTGSSTGRSSSFDCHKDEALKIQALEAALQEKEGHNAELLANCDHAAIQLQEANGRYQELEIKYKLQREQRVADKAVVDNAFEQYEAAEARRQEVERQGAAIQTVKNQEIQRVKDHHQCSLAVLTQVYEGELRAKEASIEAARALVAAKDKELDEAVHKAAEERRGYKAKAGEERRQLIKASKTIRKARETEKEKADAQYTTLTHQVMDFDNSNKYTIRSLVVRNKQLDRENQAMSIMLSHRIPTAGVLQSVINNNSASKENEKKLRGDLKQMREQNENLLDKIQQMEGHYTRHQRGEQDARSKQNELQRKVHDLELQIDRKDEQIRVGIRQLERKVGGDKSPSYCEALITLELENKDLRGLLCEERRTKMELQDQADELDKENLNLAMRYELIEEQLVEIKTKYEILEKSTGAAVSELDILREATKQHGSWTISQTDSDALLAHLQNLADANKALVEDNAKLAAEGTEARKWAANVEDKKDTEIRTWQEQFHKYQFLFHNEAETRTAQLHDEIHVLKAEKGEKHWIQSEQPMNSEVADRNALREAAKDGVEGVDPERVPAAVYGSRFVATSIPAAYEALSTLRPNEMYSLYAAGKVWSKRQIEPLSEEEASKQVASHVQARRQRSRRAAEHTGESYRPGPVTGQADLGPIRPPRGSISAAKADMKKQQQPTHSMMPMQARKSRFFG